MGGADVSNISLNLIWWKANAQNVRTFFFILQWYNLLYQFIWLSQCIVLQFPTDAAPVSLEIIPTNDDYVLCLIQIATIWLF